MIPSFVEKILKYAADKPGSIFLATSHQYITSRSQIMEMPVSTDEYETLAPLKKRIVTNFN
jgi:hypothetical protein